MTLRRRSLAPRPARRARPARPPRTARTVLAAVCALALAGCGSLPGALGGSADRDTGPITVMTWAPDGTAATNMPGMPAMAQAYARWVDASGGLRGRRLRVLTCNERNDTVEAGRCARRAIDEGAIAVVGSYSQHGRSFMPPLEVAGIPYIGGYGISTEELGSPLSYPVNGGQAALLAGNGRQLAGDCERVSLVRPDTIAGDRMAALLNAGLRQAGRPAATDVRAPEDASQYTEQAHQALRAVHGGGRPCVTAALGERTDAFFDSFRRLRADDSPVRIASVLGSVRQSLINRTGGKEGALEGASVTGWYPVADDARWEPMRKVVREHAFSDNRVDASDPGVQTTWIAYTVLRAAVLSLGDGPVTAKSVRGALDGGMGKGVDTGGLTPELSWGYEDMLAVPEFPRVTNAMVTYQVVRNGRLVSAGGEPVDVARTLER
ncbi:ABC transporter substrate-binding protein [Streptomyces sp. URMC 123]|uniref:ABC transporter substrate-binding protein n=1 Tax=Streptomyces sp. URMC 123 TaxID=3423403 RepID=UPI003F1A09E4